MHLYHNNTKYRNIQTVSYQCKNSCFIWTSGSISTTSTYHI